jgi:hypothetical protein
MFVFMIIAIRTSKFKQITWIACFAILSFARIIQETIDSYACVWYIYLNICIDAEVYFAHLQKLKRIG